MPRSRRLAGLLMLASGITHTSEPFVFGWSPVMPGVLAFGAAFFVIGLFLLREGRTVLWWGALLPGVAVALALGLVARQGSIRPLTVWHVAVDLTVVPICAYHLLRARRDPAV